MAAALKPASVTFTAIVASATIFAVAGIAIAPYARDCANSAKGLLACLQNAAADPAKPASPIELADFPASAASSASHAPIPLEIAPAPSVAASREAASGAASAPTVPRIDQPSVAMSMEVAPAPPPADPPHVALGEGAPQIDATIVAAIPPAPPAVELSPAPPIGDISATPSEELLPMPTELLPPSSDTASPDIGAEPDVSASEADPVGNVAPPPAVEPIPKRNSVSITTLQTNSSPSVTTLPGTTGANGSIIVQQREKGPGGNVSSLPPPAGPPTSITSLN